MIDKSTLYQQPYVNPSSSQMYVNYPNTYNEDKREIIKRQLETSFPTKTTILFGFIPIIIGITAIGLQIGLLVNNAIHCEIGNGIWGGIFAIINGLIRLNMGKIKTKINVNLMIFIQ